MITSKKEPLGSLVGELVSCASWDQSTSKVEKIDHLLANSHYTASLIKKHYQREAPVIHPFVDLEKFLTFLSLRSLSLLRRWKNSEF